MKLMKHFLILKKERCMTNLGLMVHKDLVVKELVKVDIIHILLMALMDLVASEILVIYLVHSFLDLVVLLEEVIEMVQKEVEI